MTFTSGPHPATEAQVQTQPADDTRAVLLRAFAMERVADQDIGWDTVQPMLFQFLRSPNSDMAGVVVAPLPPTTGGAASLAAFARRADLAAFVPVDRVYLGLGIIFEGWIRTIKPGEPLPDRPLADIPGTDEARFLAGILTGGDAFVLQRIRDHQPVVFHGDHDTLNAIHSEGVLSDELKDLHERIEQHCCGQKVGNRPGPSSL